MIRPSGSTRGRQKWFRQATFLLEITHKPYTTEVHLLLLFSAPHFIQLNADDVKLCLSYNYIASGFNLQSDIVCFP